MADDQPEKERTQYHDRGHLLHKGQTEQNADGHPPSPPVRLVQSVPEGERRGRPEQETRGVCIHQMGLAVKAGHQQERAGHDQADPLARSGEPGSGSRS